MKKTVSQQQVGKWGRRSAALAVSAALAAALLALPASAAAGAQQPDTPAFQYVSTVKSTIASNYFGMTAVSGGGVIAVGNAIGSGSDMGSYTTDNDGLLLSKLDTSGKLVWANKLEFGDQNGNNSEYGSLSSVTRLTNGTYLAVGVVNYYGGDFTITGKTAQGVQSWTGNDGDGQNFVSQAVLVYFDGNGNVLHLQFLTSSGNVAVGTVQATPDGGFVLLGAVGSFDRDFADLTGHRFIRKYTVDSNYKLTPKWTRYQDGYYFTTMKTASDGTIAAVGLSPGGSTPLDDSGKPVTGINTGATAVNLCAAEINPQDGSTKWETWYPGGTGDPASGDAEEYDTVTPTADGGLLAAGYTTSPNFKINGSAIKKQGQEDFLVAKYSASGSVEWMKNYGGSSADYIRGSVQQPDGSYVVSGQTYSKDQDLNSSLRIIKGVGNILMKLNKDGTLGWITSVQGSGNNVIDGYDCLVQEGSSYIFAGSSGSTDYDFANDGNTGSGVNLAYIASFSYDSDGDGVPNTRDYFPNDASKSLPADPDSVYDLSVAPATSFGSSDKGSVSINRGNYDYAGDGTPTSITDNTKVTAGAFSAVMPEGILDNLFRVTGTSNSSLIFKETNATASTSVSGEKVLYAGTISVTDAKGHAVDTSALGTTANVTFTVPAGSGYDAGKNPKLVYIGANGNANDVAGADIKQNTDGSLTVTFSTDHFSTYAVVQTADATGTGTTGDGTTNTGTTGTGTAGSGTTGTNTTSTGTGTATNTAGTSGSVANPNTGWAQHSASLQDVVLALLGVSAAGLTFVILRRRRHN